MVRDIREIRTGCTRWGWIWCSLAWALGLGVAPGCSSNGSGQDMTVTGVAGGPVKGAVDTHCSGDGGMIIQPTSMAACSPDQAGPQPDMAGQDTGSDYGVTMHNSSGSDDDCKYNLSFSNSPTVVTKNEGITLKVTATSRADGSAVTGAMVVTEVFLDATHPAPNSGVRTTEGPGGTYTITPLQFDQSGTWTVRFHLFEDCLDLREDSPHGHAAFYFNVD